MYQLSFSKSAFPEDYSCVAMSKSNKKKKSVSASSPIVDQSKLNKSDTASTLNQPILTTSVLGTIVQATTIPLIHFDKKVKWFLAIWTTLFLILTLASIHTLSLSMWNQLLPDGALPNKGLISGTAQAIRMDEYAVWVPSTLSNANKGYPIVNETLGGEKIALFGSPSKHLFMLFKPFMWGHFFLSIDQAIAWQSNFHYFMMVIFSFLFFLLVTNNQFSLSVFGSLWLLFSSGSTNWNGGADASLAMFSLLFVSSIYILFGRQSMLAKIGLGIAFGWALTCLFALAYPPFQVPLGYAYLLIFVGYVLNTRRSVNMDGNFYKSVAAGAVGTIIVGILFYFVYQDLRETINALANTVYPGRRSESGGTGFIANWFSEYYSWLISPQRYPKSWLNICELSHYITFVPVSTVCLVGLTVRTKQLNWMLILLSIWLLCLIAWIELGWPKWLAEATLMSMSPTRRTQIPFGAASVIFTIIYLGHLTWVKQKGKLLHTSLAISGVVAFMLYTAYVNLNDAEGLFKPYQMFIPFLLFTALNVMLLYNLRIPYRIPIFAAGVLIYLLPNLKFNPVAVGLSPITDHTLYKAVRAIEVQDPNRRWVVFGSQYISYMITATGVNLLTGVKTLPDRKIMSILDPGFKRDSTYNRYAHTVYSTFINGTDSVFIQNNFEDGCIIAMDPCSPKFKKLDVKYLVFDREPQPVEIRCAKLINVLGTIKIYQRND